jgi:hypothetical protein
VVVALVIALGCLLAGCSPGNGGSAQPDVVFGFNDDPTPRWFGLQAELGMPLRRFPVPWSEVEATPGRWTWSRFDTLYREMRADGLRPLIMAIGAPCWAQGLRPPCAPGASAPAFYAAWARYVRRLAVRYPATLGIEIWNEPNAVRMFPPHPDPARYAALLKAAYGAVKGVNPRLPVISGGLLPSPTTNRYAIADWQFLRGVYAAGAAGSMDAIGAHPYPISAGSGGRSRYDLAAMEQDLERLRAVRDAAGESATPIWITEMGVSTQSGGGFPPGATQAQQADDLLAMIRAVREDGDVRVALVHRLVDVRRTPAGGALARLESGFGVFGSNGAPKRAACALSAEFGGSLSC